MISTVIIVSWALGCSVPAGVRLFCTGLDWQKKLAAPTWDFGKSWASNLTAAGGILSYTALLSCFTPTANLHFGARQAYLAVGTLAAGLAVLAPLVFNVLSRTLEACGSKSACAIAFLSSAGISASAVIMQIGLGAGVTSELVFAKVIPFWLADVMLVSVAVFALVLVWYAILTAADTLKASTIGQKEMAVGAVASGWTLL